MQLTLNRKPSAKGATLSNWYVDGQPECVGCEDEVRDPGVLLYGKTAIAAGTYPIIINRSARFSKLAGHDVFLPLLQNVPGYEGVRIHPGNTAADTEGCLLPGTRFGADGKSVEASQAAFKALFLKMQQAVARGESLKVTIR